ncbi:MAG: protein kinase [Minicystis sp.]
MIDEEIGRGGMGVVYRVTDRRTGRRCAFKQIRSELVERSDALERFRTETSILASLDHPCIVTMYAAGTHEGRPYIVMEWIQGRTLRELMQIRRAPFTLTQTLSMAIQIGSALIDAHRLRVVHRDLKPENVIIRRRRHLKVVDFGIGKLHDGVTTTDRLMPLATPLYAAPEQLARKPVDGRTDVYALALMIVEMATGQHAFAEPGETMPTDGVAAALARAASPNRLIDHVPGCPESLSALVERALYKSRERRPDMATFVSALRGERARLARKDASGARGLDEGDADEEAGEDEDASPSDPPPAPDVPAQRETMEMPPSFAPADPLARFRSRAGLGPRGTARMASASALLAAKGRTLEHAQAEASTRPASLPPPPASGRRPIALVPSPAPTSPLHPAGATPDAVIPRPSIEAPIARPRLETAPAAKPRVTGYVPPPMAVPGAARAGLRRVAMTAFAMLVAVVAVLLVLELAPGSRRPAAIGAPAPVPPASASPATAAPEPEELRPTATATGPALPATGAAPATTPARPTPRSTSRLTTTALPARSAAPTTKRPFDAE